MLENTKCNQEVNSDVCLLLTEALMTDPLITVWPSTCGGCWRIVFLDGSPAPGLVWRRGQELSPAPGKDSGDVPPAKPVQVAMAWPRGGR